MARGNDSLPKVPRKDFKWIGWLEEGCVRSVLRETHAHHNRKLNSGMHVWLSLMQHGLSVELMLRRVAMAMMMILSTVSSGQVRGMQ